jgi:hypothetical protein
MNAIRYFSFLFSCAGPEDNGSAERHTTTSKLMNHYWGHLPCRVRSRLQKESPCSETESELYRRMSKLVSTFDTFVDKGCHVVSVTDPYGRILGFIDRSRYFFLQVALQLYSRRRMNPGPALTCWARSGDVMNFLWGTDKPIELSWVLNKRQGDG